MHDPISIQIKNHSRAKRVKITVYPDATVVLTKPHRTSESFVRDFISAHRAWLEERVAYYKENPQPKPRYTKEHYCSHKEAARRLVHAKLEHFSKLYNVSYGRVSIKNQRSRWGSCSAKGNLNFNYRILFLSPAEQDYLIVHELCHLKELNHSDRFWDLVARAIPDHKDLQESLLKVTL